MTIHIDYSFKCPECNSLYIPCGDLKCLVCGKYEPERFDFIPKAAESLQRNIVVEGSFEPGAWIFLSLADLILGELFRLFEIFRLRDKDIDFDRFLEEWQEKGKLYCSDNYETCLLIHICEIAEMVYPYIKEYCERKEECSL